MSRIEPAFSTMLRAPLLYQPPVPPHKGSAKSLRRCVSKPDDELCKFRRFLCYLGTDLTCCVLPFSPSILSWIIFSLVSVVFPVIFCVLFAGLRPYDLAVQIPLTLSSGLAFHSLNNLSRKYGLRRSLFLDQLQKDSPKVRADYIKLVHKALLTLVFSCLLPVTTLDALYKAYWYHCTIRDPSMASQVPKLLTSLWMASFLFTLELTSFAYRVAVLFLDCVLFKLNCHLQVLRMEDFTKVFHAEPGVVSILKQHIRLRKQLRIISHRHRFFIISFLITATASQFWTLLLTTRPHAQFNLFVGGELFLGGACLVGGILMCLGSAACITHKAQALTSHAATWHACATINPCNPSMAADVEAATAAENPPTPISAIQTQPTVTMKFDSASPPLLTETTTVSAPATMSTVQWACQLTEATFVSVRDNDISGDASSRSVCSNSSNGSYRQLVYESDGDDQWALDMDKLMITQTAISYQKRQAIVTYLENNRGGITIYGFMVDRTWLHALFMIEFSLVMWLLGKTVSTSRPRRSQSATLERIRRESPLP